MNMENNTCEGGKCNGGECGSCNHGCMMGHGCCGWNKRHMIKKIIMIVLLIVVFCFGIQVGELKSAMRYDRGVRMMGWGYDGGTGYMSGWNNVKSDTNTPTTTTPKQ